MLVFSFLYNSYSVVYILLMLALSKAGEKWKGRMCVRLFIEFKKMIQSIIYVRSLQQCCHKILWKMPKAFNGGKLEKSVFSMSEKTT